MTLVARSRALLSADVMLSNARTLFFVLAVLALVGSVLLGGLVSALVFLVLVAGILAIARGITAPEESRFVVSLVMTVLVLRVILALVLDSVLKARGTPGTLFLGDGGYLSVASQLAES